jgi:hypothetical protein
VPISTFEGREGYGISLYKKIERREGERTNGGRRRRIEYFFF